MFIMYIQSAEINLFQTETKDFQHIYYYITQKLQLKLEAHLKLSMQTTSKQLNQFISVDTNTLLGKGSTGNVYKGLNLDPKPHPIAIKAILLEQINNEVTKYLLECELEALKATSKFHNESIVRLEQIIVRDGYCYIATELLEGGTLKDYIVQQKKLQPATALNILRRLLQGYKILKDNGIIHRDLKPQNVLFLSNPNTSDPVPKIIDFGYCIVSSVKNIPKMFYNVGSPRYMSPEAYTSNKYSQKSDIWALGIIFYEMLTGTTFDKGKNIIESFKLIKQKGIPIPSSLNSKCRSIMQHMLMLDPNCRYSCEQILDEIVQGDQRGLSNMNFNVSSNKHLKQLRSTIINDRKYIPPSPKSPSPDPRASMFYVNSPLKMSGFLTKSLGFVVSPVSRDANRPNLFNYPNLPKEKISLQNRNPSQQYRQGSLSDRKNKDNLRQSLNNGEVEHNLNLIGLNENEKNEKHLQFKTYITPEPTINRSLQDSASEQNLHKKQADNISTNYKYHSARNEKQAQNFNRDKEIMKKLFQQRHQNQANKLNKSPTPFHINELQNQGKVGPSLNHFQSRLAVPLSDNQNIVQNNQRLNVINVQQPPPIHVINNQPKIASQFSPQQFSIKFQQPNPIPQQEQIQPLGIQLPQQHHVNFQHQNIQQVHPTPTMVQQVHQPFQSSSSAQGQILTNNTQHHFVQQQFHPQLPVNNHLHPQTIHFKTGPIQIQDKSFGNTRNNVMVFPITPHGEAMMVRNNKPEYNFLHSDLQHRPRIIEQTHI